MEEILLNIDKAIFSFINGDLSSLLLDVILIPLRHKMFWIPFYLFIMLLILLNYSRKKWIIFLGLGLSVFLTDSINSHVLKKEFERIRPCHCDELEAIARIPCGIGYSFPSSHAANHFGIATFLFLLLSYSKWKWIFPIWALIISFAQIYVGVHYPFDVLGGALFGVFIGLLCFLFYKMAERKFFQNIKLV